MTNTQEPRPSEKNHFDIFVLLLDKKKLMLVGAIHSLEKKTTESFACNIYV